MVQFLGEEAGVLRGDGPTHSARTRVHPAAGTLCDNHKQILSNVYLLRVSGCLTTNYLQM